MATAIHIRYTHNIFTHKIMYSRPKFIFFDKNKTNIYIYEKILGIYRNMMFTHGTLNYILQKYYLKYPFGLVLSTNSYGDMSRGICSDIENIFPLCKGRVLNLIKKSPYIDISNNPYLSVGECCAITLDKDNMILVAPISIKSEDICGTENVYNAFSAIYKISCELSNNMVILCPCLGIDYGMSGVDSANQIHRVLIDTE